MGNNKNYYEILGIRPDAPIEDITAAKNALAKQYHPDVNLKNGIDTTEQMQEILEAYRILSDSRTRADYDRKSRGNRPVFQNYDLSHMSDAGESAPTFVNYWKASSALYDIVLEGDALFHQKDTGSQLTQLALQALPYILLLRKAQIPESYWHPDIMNWLLFQWYKNRNYPISYLLELYDTYARNSYSRLEHIKIKNRAKRYQHSVKKLMKY